MATSRPSSSRPRPSRPALERRSISIAVLVCLVVVGSVMALGAVHLTTLLVLTPLAVLACLVRLAQPNATLPWAAVVCWLLACACLLQAVPLPEPLLERLSPEGLDVWTRAERLAVTPRSTLHSVSLHPGGSMREALKWLSSGALIMATAATCEAFGRRFVVRLVFVSGVLVALVTLGHALLGAEELFGLYRPRDATPRFGLAPLLNPNNLAGYLNLSAFAGMGLLMDERRTARRWAFGLGVVAVLTVSILSASRGGLLAFLAGLVLLELVRRRTQAKLPRVGWFVPGALVAAIALAFLAASERIWRELADTSSDKLTLFASATRIIADYPLLGIGRGAFHSVSSSYRASTGSSSAEFAENFVLQWASEWGLALTLLALGSFYLSTRARAGRQRPTSAPVLALTVGLLVLLAQNLVDLALEVPGVAFAAATVFGLLAHQSGRTWLLSSSSQRWICACAVVIPSVVAWLGAEPTTSAQRQTLFRALEEARGEAELASVHEQALQALASRPADAYVAYVGGSAAERVPALRNRSLVWLAYALERDPGSAEVHLELARAIRRRGNLNQALLHLQKAAALTPPLARQVATTASQWTSDFTLQSRAVPEGRPGAPVLYELARLNKANSLAFVDEGLSRAADDVDLNRLAIRSLLAALRSRKAPCADNARQACLERAHRHLTALRAQPSKASDTHLFSARLLAITQGPERAYAELSAACSETVSAACWREATTLAKGIKDDAPFVTAGNAYIALECARPETCAAALRWVGDANMSRGSFFRAMDLYSREINEYPTAAAWNRLAAAADKAGQKERAAWARQRAAGTP